MAAGVGNGGSGGGAGAAAGSAAAVARRFSMEGVGARVIRGPDWKWNKQVGIVRCDQRSGGAPLRHCLFFLAKLIKSMRP